MGVKWKRCSICPVRDTCDMPEKSDCRLIRDEADAEIQKRDDLLKENVKAWAHCRMAPCEKCLSGDVCPLYASFEKIKNFLKGC